MSLLLPLLDWPEPLSQSLARPFGKGLEEGSEPDPMRLGAVGKVETGVGGRSPSCVRGAVDSVPRCERLEAGVEESLGYMPDSRGGIVGG